MLTYLVYCLPLYGCTLWSLSPSYVKSLQVLIINGILRKIWHLPRTSHTSILPDLLCNLIVYGFTHERFLMRMVFTLLMSCHSSFGVYSPFVDCISSQSFSLLHLVCETTIILISSVSVYLHEQKIWQSIFVKFP